MTCTRQGAVFFHHLTFSPTGHKGKWKFEEKRRTGKKIVSKWNHLTPLTKDGITKKKKELKFLGFWPSLKNNRINNNLKIKFYFSRDCQTCCSGPERKSGKTKIHIRLQWLFHSKRKELTWRRFKSKSSRNILQLVSKPIFSGRFQLQPVKYSRTNTGRRLLGFCYWGLPVVSGHFVVVSFFFLIFQYVVKCV